MRFNTLSFIAIFGTAFANADVGKVKVNNTRDFPVRYWIVTQTPPGTDGPFAVQSRCTSDGHKFAEGGFNIKVVRENDELKDPHLDWAMNVNKDQKVIVYDVNNIHGQSDIDRVRIDPSEGSRCSSIDSQEKLWKSGDLGTNCHGDILHDFTLTVCYKDGGRSKRLDGNAPGILGRGFP